MSRLDDFVTAFAMLLSTDRFSYILRWKLQASLHLIQKLFVEIADGVKVPHKVLNELYLDVNVTSYTGVFHLSC